MVNSKHEKEVSKPPNDTSMEAEHMSLLKEIREQISEMRSEMRSLKSELHQTRHVPHGEEDRATNSVQEVITVLSTW